MPNRPHKEHHVHHPAHNLYIVSIIFTALVVIFGFITVFIPWAQKDIAVGQRAWAFPFKTCIENTFSDVNEETCIDNDFIEPQGVPLTGASEECKAYILATIAFVFLSVLPGVILLILIGYILEHLWWHPLKVAMVANIILIFVMISCFLAWGFFIVYMEMTCAPGSIFPVAPGYSYGWIMYLFNTVFSIIAVVTGFLGWQKIKKYKKQQGFIEDLEQEKQQMMELNPYPQPMMTEPYPLAPLPPLAPMAMSLPPQVSGTYAFPPPPMPASGFWPDQGFPAYQPTTPAELSSPFYGPAPSYPTPFQ